MYAFYIIFTIFVESSVKQSKLIERQNEMLEYPKPVSL